MISIVSCQWKRDSKNDKYYVISDTTNYSDFQITYDSNNKEDYFSVMKSLNLNENESLSVLIYDHLRKISDNFKIIDVQR